MRTTTIKGHTIELYDSIDELPIKRFHKFNKMLLIDACIGSDLTDFDRHLSKVLLFIKDKQTDNAVTELDNLRQNVYLVQTEMSPRYLAFACLVSKLDGKECNDLSDGALKNILETLSDLSVEEITALQEAVKKKIDDEMYAYFPALTDNALQKEYYDQIKKRTLLLLEETSANKNNEAEIEEITRKMIIRQKPKSFNGKNNAEIEYDKDFERMCVIIAKNLNTNPKEYSVLEFYTAYEHIKEMHKAQKKPNKRQI